MISGAINKKNHLKVINVEITIMNTDICDLNTITGKYVYIKIWGQAIEDCVALVSILVSMMTFAFIQFQKYYYKQE